MAIAVLLNFKRALTTGLGIKPLHMDLLTLKFSSCYTTFITAHNSYSSGAIPDFHS